MAEAEMSGEELADRIIELGEAQRYEDVLGISRDPATRDELQTVAATVRRRAELYLREADRWWESRHETTIRRLGEARRALDGLDLELARGLMNRIDGRFLDPDEQEERDRLLLDISARTMELEDLDEGADRLISEDRKDQPWWRRRKR